jgi:hypothetical protein
MLGINTPVETYTPDCSVVSVLTLLSAFLLLSKPRKSTPKKTAEPTANEGATS